jgi:hypothetical protein
LVAIATSRRLKMTADQHDDRIEVPPPSIGRLGRHARLAEGDDGSRRLV